MRLTGKINSRPVVNSASYGVSMKHSCGRLIVLFVGMVLCFPLLAYRINESEIFEPYEFKVVETGYFSSDSAKKLEQVSVTIINDKETYDNAYRALHDDLGIDHEIPSDLDFANGSVLLVDLACIDSTEVEVHTSNVFRAIDKVYITFSNTAAGIAWQVGEPGTSRYELIYVHKKILTISVPDATQRRVCGG